eukprot:TRINITY_DN10334_c0_g1_i1.p1 TRINITY_DN10334_c0_g1~~TRINITY_DN10334_c0_g1_i1.p1  ORF type:complete len:137 (-),score=32.24 TRINITY_DN10334_c0_g1_i1:4-414(-)
MFYQLFNSFGDELRSERLWILQVIRHGLRSYEDVRIVKRRHALQILLTFFDSSVGDPASHAIVLQILRAACQIRRGAILLVTSGFLPWLIQVSLTPSTDIAVVYQLVEMVTLVVRRSAWAVLSCMRRYCFRMTRNN